MAETTNPRPYFETDGHSLASTAVRDQAAAPALSSSDALARFEFESGRGNEGTKILMVEWTDDLESAANPGKWDVSWAGKSTSVAQRDGADGKVHRLYFLIAPGISVPSSVTISQVGGKTMQTNPLPAIFPPELGASGKMIGKKGVLHTVWAKQRLSVLQLEIEREAKVNSEGIALDMAVKEKEWIESNFGIGPRTTSASHDEKQAQPASPTSPGGGRLSEKLKGLRLGTSAADLSARSSTPSLVPLATKQTEANPLSPDVGDVAVSSFSLFHGGTSRPSRAVAQLPPDHILAQQAENRGAGPMGSLAAIADDVPHVSRIANIDHNADGGDEDDDDDLFAVTMSPRSPEMTKSPFSFSREDIHRASA